MKCRLCKPLQICSNIVDISSAFKFENGIIGSGIWSFVANENSQIDQIQITGDKGTINFSTFDFLPIKLRTEGHNSEYHPENPVYFEVHPCQDPPAGKHNYLLNDTGK